MIRKFLPALSFLLLLSGCNQDPKVAGQRLLETGNRYLESGKYKEASIILRRAIQKDRRFAEAYYKLGVAEQHLGRYRQSLGALTRAVELDPVNQDAYGRLADLYLAIYLSNPERYEHFLEDLQRITESAEQHFPDAFDINRVKAFVALSAKSYEEAFEGFRRANEQRPDDRRVALGLVQAQAGTGDVDGALERARAYVEKDSGFGEMYDFIYIQQAARRDLDAALSTLQQKIANNPDSLLYQLQLARHYLFVRNQEKMNEVLDGIMAADGRFSNPWTSVGEFFLRIRDFDRALSTFRQGAESDPSRALDYRNRIVEVLAIQGRFDEAFREVNETLQGNPEDPTALALRGAIRLRGGDRAEVESATNDFEAALAGKPKNAVLRYNLAEAYRAQGNLDRATLEYKTSIDLRKNYMPPRYRLASLQIQKGDFAGAVATVEEALEYFPNDLRGRMLRASAWIRLGQYQQAKESLEEMVVEAPQARDPKLELARLYLRDKEFAKAEALFRELHEMTPPDERGLLGLADLHILQGAPGRAVSLLEGQLEQGPDRVAVRLALGSTYLKLKRFDDALRVLKEAEAGHPDDGQLIRMLGGVYYTMGDVAQAQRYLSRAAELLPNDPSPMLYMGMLAERQGAIQQAVERYEEVLELAPDNVVALNNLAYILAETTSDMDRALTLIQKARGLAPADPDIADTLGYVYIKKELPGSALPVLNDLVNKRPGVVIWRYHLALAHYEHGDVAKARQHLKTALSHQPSEEERFKINELLSRLGS